MHVVVCNSLPSFHVALPHNVMPVNSTVLLMLCYCCANVKVSSYLDGRRSIGYTYIFKLDVTFLSWMLHGEFVGGGFFR